MNPIQVNQYLPIIGEWQNVIAKVRGLERSDHHALLEASSSKPIKIVSGFRRSGKSFLVQMVANALVKAEKFSLGNILYLNFEDYRLAEISQIASLDTLVQYFLNKLAGLGKKLLIFDEIQLVPQWDKLIRTLYEKEQDIEIFLTGSNSELLSSEIGSNLAGRFIEFQILPFSFKEFLAFNELIIEDETDFYKNLPAIKSYFTQYLQFGGLPEIFSIKNENTKFSYLQGILSKVILDDIIERFEVRQPMIIEKIIHYLFVSVGNVVAPARIVNLLANEKITIKPDTVSTYIDYITKTFAMFEVNRFDWKLNRVFNTRKKYYAVDTGIINLFRGTTNNYSKQLENIVFLKLKKDFSSINYSLMIGEREIDFLVKDRGNSYSKFQVATHIAAENKERELSAFITSDQHLNKANNFLLTMEEQEDILKINNTVITKKYLLKWLLDI